MPGNTTGTIFTVTTFGESHGEAIGVIVDGAPALIPWDEAFIQSEMDRRRPGSTTLGTARNEGDKIKTLSGVYEGKTTGTSIAMLIENTNQHSHDYDQIAHTFRPGHADYTFTAKYGIRDPRGGGRSSGRESAARVAAGAVAKLMLREKGITITAGTVALGGIKAEYTSWNPPFSNPLLCPDEKAALLMATEIEKARSEMDSIGGIIEVHATGIPAGLGDPVFGKLDARLAAASLSIGGCKGFEMGDGFRATELKGSENNDQMYLQNGKPAFFTNHAGGVLGGISNGNEIVFRLAMKPTPSISQMQKSITDEGKEVPILIKGRHDPSIVPRAIVVAEAMCAITIADCYLLWSAYHG